MEGTVADLLTPGEYEEEMTDANGRRAITLKVIDITGDFEDADQTLLVYYGIDETDKLVVQLVEDRITSKRRSLILPREAYDNIPPVTIQRFIGASRRVAVVVVARLVRENDK
ncbi:MAG: hypothetical protein WC813_02085 [Patescibacteria group bacterium]